MGDATDLAMNLKTGFLKKISMRLCLFTCAGLLSFFSLSSSSNAQPTSPCDPEYMDALEARAWLEAQREISQNKNFIFKPDSVLEYTCFGQFMNIAASNFGANRQFSETDKWDGHPDGFSSITTDLALSEVVIKPLASYLAANFNTAGPNADGFNAGAYLNNRRSDEYRPQVSVRGGFGYNCAEMQKVWKMARCMNFNETPENDFDGFFDFAYYSGNDPRRESEEWELMCLDPDPRFEAARTTAFNADQDLFDVGIEIIEAEGNGEPYLEDDIVTHLNWILPGSCNGRVPTGIVVQRPDLNDGDPYDEVVCTNPGCTADTDGRCSN